MIFIGLELLINDLEGKILKHQSHFIALCHLLEVFEDGKRLKKLPFKLFISNLGPMKITR